MRGLGKAHICCDLRHRYSRASIALMSLRHKMTGMALIKALTGVLREILQWQLGFGFMTKGCLLNTRRARLAWSWMTRLRLCCRVYRTLMSTLHVLTTHVLSRSATLIGMGFHALRRASNGQVALRMACSLFGHLRKW